jgi:hypothetical protein
VSYELLNYGIGFGWDKQMRVAALLVTLFAIMVGIVDIVSPDSLTTARRRSSMPDARKPVEVSGRHSSGAPLGTLTLG